MSWTWHSINFKSPRINNGVTEYFVNFGPDIDISSSWEPEENVIEALQIWRNWKRTGFAYRRRKNHDYQIAAYIANPNEYVPTNRYMRRYIASITSSNSSSTDLSLSANTRNGMQELNMQLPFDSSYVSFYAANAVPNRENAIHSQMIPKEPTSSTPHLIQTSVPKIAQPYPLEKRDIGLQVQSPHINFNSNVQFSVASSASSAEAQHISSVNAPQTLISSASKSLSKINQKDFAQVGFKFLKAHSVIIMPTLEYFFTRDYNFKQLCNFFQLHRKDLISFIKYIRTNYVPFFHTEQIVDKGMHLHLEKISRDFVSIVTSGDGNCLFNALSICIFGDESKSMILKFCCTFIIQDNESFFKPLSRYYGTGNYEKELCDIVAKPNAYQSNFTIQAACVLINRPIWLHVFNSGNSSINNPLNQTSSPLHISYTLNPPHFAAMLPTNETAQINKPANLAITKLFYFRNPNASIKDY